MQAAHDDDILRKIKQLLGCDKFSIEEQKAGLCAYSRSLEEEQRPLLGTLHDPESLEQFKADPKGKLSSWIESKESSVLLLVGHNDESFFHSHYCWTSPIAVDRITQLVSDPNPNPYAFFVLQNEGITYEDVIPAILFQLLQTRKRALREGREHDELETLLQRAWAAVESNSTSAPIPPIPRRSSAVPSSPGSQGSPQTFLSSRSWLQPSGSPESTGSRRKKEYKNKRAMALKDIAVRVVDMFESTETVDIVIDRLDFCRARAAGDREIDNRRILLQTLSEMVAKARATVKVMVVSNWHGWTGFQDESESDLGIVLDVREQQVRC